VPLSPLSPQPTVRKLILHYHLFKNAGTSVDELLKRSFGSRWVTREFNGGGPAAHRAELARWLQEERDAVAFSSHTAQLPPPAAAGVECFPLIFVRHPIDRIASAYAFETKHGGSGFGAVLARNTTLAGYIEVRLSLGHDRQCRNFHVARLAQMFPATDGDERARAMKALDALPFVGLVEAFDAAHGGVAATAFPGLPGCGGGEERHARARHAAGRQAGRATRRDRRGAVGPVAGR